MLIILDYEVERCGQILNWWDSCGLVLREANFAEVFSVFRRVRKIANSHYWLRHSCLSVHPHEKNSAPTGQNFMKFHI